MKQAKERPVWWVATTHALTTSFVWPFVGSVAGVMIAGAMDSERESLVPFYVFNVFMLLGYGFGAVYSMSYLKKVAVLARPADYVTPTVVTATLLVFVGMVVNLMMFGGDRLRTTLIIIQSALAAAIVAGVTVSAFRNWPSRA